MKGADSTTYGLVRDYSGENFFDGWTFYGDCAFVFLLHPWIARLTNGISVDNVTNGDAEYVHIRYSLFTHFDQKSKIVSWRKRIHPISHFLIRLPGIPL